MNRQRLNGLAATLGIVAIVAGLPILLLAIGVSRLPSRLPTWARIEEALRTPDDGSLALGVFAVIAWLAWAFVTISILIEVVNRIQGTRTPSLPGFRLPQAAARNLVGTAALLFVVTPTVLPAAQPVALTHAVAFSADAATPAPARAPVAPDGAVSTKPHPVAHGETLWSIARTELGDGARYPEIVDLNRELLNAGPGFLDVGWVLQIPADKATLRGVQLAPGDRVVTVRPNDTLSAIAEIELNDAAAYPEIFEASRGIVQLDGAQLTDPDLIEPGWTLVIPGENEGNGSPNKDDWEPAPAPEHLTKVPTPAPEPTPPTSIDDPERQPWEMADGDTSAGAEESGDRAPWLILGLTGAGAVLAVGLQGALRARRRAQFRVRQPGRMIHPPDPQLASVEKTVNVEAPRAEATVEFMDQALRRLARQQADNGQPMPALAAVELKAETVVLHLTEPAELDDPWEGTPDRLHWRRRPGDDCRDLEEQPAPYPMLVTAGSADDGAVWLLNCEELAVVTIAGNPKLRCDFARYVAAELAMQVWSHGIVVECVGVAEEIVPLQRERIHYREPGPGSDDIATELLADMVSTIDRSRASAVDVPGGRAGEVGDDVWPARVLLLDAANQRPAMLDQILDLAVDHAGETGAAVVIVGDLPDVPGTVLRLTDEGRLQLPEAGLDLIAVGLTADEAEGCAALLAQAERLDGADFAVDQEDEGDWESYVTQAGSLRTEQTMARDDDDVDSGSSLLDARDEVYVERAAVVPEDLEAFAPSVSTEIRDKVEAADPELDQGLADWLDPESRQPKLTLLGPVHLRAHGKPLAERRAFYTELIAYLSLRRRHGATPDEVADAFNLKPARVRVDINKARYWLGVNPATGSRHLPEAAAAPASVMRGVNVYQVDDGLLVDLDLFRRLFARGQARGADGLVDLRQALGLVGGRPFDQLRKAGWNWLLEGDRLDLQMQAAVADVAHIVATHALSSNDLKLARFAVERSVLAAPDEDTTQLNRAALAEAEGHHQEAARILREDVCNRSDGDEAPTDLSVRTEQIIRNHDWLATG